MHDRRSLGNTGNVGDEFYRKISTLRRRPKPPFHRKGLGFDIDFKRFLAEFETRGTLVRAYYYTTIAEDAELQTSRPLIDWLDYNGFTVRAKPVKIR